MIPTKTSLCIVSPNRGLRKIILLAKEFISQFILQVNFTHLTMPNPKLTITTSKRAKVRFPQEMISANSTAPGTDVPVLLIF